MEAFLCFLKRSVMGLMLAWAGLNPTSFAATSEDNWIHFGIYSITPAPGKASGSARLKEGVVELSTVPSYIKQAILSPKAINPFKTVYRSIYQPAFLKQLQKCSFIGMPYEIDGNPKTQEWVVMTVFYGCIKGYNSLVSAEPHNWILQQDAKKQFRVLMESDGSSLSLTKSQSRQKNYDHLLTDHYVVNFLPTARPQCGMVSVKWQYRQNRYQVIKQQTLPVGCESLFEYGGNFEMLPEAARNDHRKKAQKAVESVVAPWLKQLKALR